MELKLDSNKPKKRLFSMSKREKNLLLLLITALIVWLSINFVITPQMDKIDTLKAEKVNYEAQVQELEEMLLREKAINEEWAKLQYDYAEAARKYFPTVDQPELMHLLNTAIDEGNLEVTAMSFSDPKALKLEDLDASLMGVNLPFRGTYKDLEDFIAQLRANPKRLLLEQIELYKETENQISGQLGIEAFTFGSDMEIKDGYFYTNAYSASGKLDPFAPFAGYVESAASSDDGEHEDEGRTVVNDLDGNDIYFMSTGQEVTGTVSVFPKAKYGKNSIRAEYFITSGYQPERAYITLDDKNIMFRYPPKSIGVWAYAFGYSPVTVGFRFQDMDGDKIDVELARGVNWSGWEYISATPPQDINVYPLKLDRIYFELGPNRDDYGVMLFDRIECEYEEDEEDEEDANYVFYVVQPGDTLMSISEKFYGTKSAYKKLAIDNGLPLGGILEAGKVLVISK